MSEDASLYSKQVSQQMDDRAPDMTEIRFLASMQRGSMVHCTLPVARTSQAGKHQSVEEMWYVAQGEGALWRQNEQEEREERLVAGMCFTITAGTVFQVRNSGNEPLVCIIVTMPPWPGVQEWERAQDHWMTR
jgi:mannose-6-phosphate isomerase-like protein (cupin superfamily)